MHMHGLDFSDQAIPHSSAGQYHLVQTWGHPHSENHHLRKDEVNMEIILEQAFGTRPG